MAESASETPVRGISTEALKSVATPDRVESRLGTLEFEDGAPSAETAALVDDNLDFQHGVQAFLGAIPGASLVRLYNPLQPFFDKSWRPSEIEVVV